MILNELRPLAAPSPDEVGCRSRYFLYSCVDAVQVIRPLLLLSRVFHVFHGVSAVQIIL